MALSIQDYLIEQGGIDWSVALSHWNWLLPQKFTIWFVNRIADLFIVLPDGTVHMLDVGGGILQKVAEDRDDFRAKIDDEENASNWLAIPLVDRLVGAGVKLNAGECYGFKQPPILGGDYSVENVAPISINDYLTGYASILEQLRGVPDGTSVVLKVQNAPGRND